jgi:prevent-host-death family protein
MSTVTALEAKTRFGELLDRVSRGEEIVITRHEKPVARIVPEGRSSLRQVREAASELKALRQQMTRRRGFKPVTNAEIRKAIEEGRS